MRNDSLSFKKVKISPCKEDEHAWQAKEFYRLYSLTKNSRVELVDSYDDADIVFVTDLPHKNLFAGILSKPEHVIHYNKLVCHYEQDGPPEKVPGIYTCGSIDAPATRGAPFYLWLLTHPIPEFNPLDEIERPYLFSFMGRNCNQVRKEILDLGSVVGTSLNYYLEDTTNSYPIFDSVKKRIARVDSMESQRELYFDVLRKTKFALAPKGTGLSSIRQDEAIAYGCVPVIISDKLKLPANVDWKKCSVRVQEKDINKIPQILKSLEANFLEMSLAVKEAYHQLYDPGHYWHYIEQSILEVYQGQRASIGELKKEILMRDFRRTLYRRKLAIRRLIARFQ